MENMGVENNDQALDLLLEKVYREGGHDFRDYKRGTVTRRLQRRLYATGATTYLEYMCFLDSHPEEYQRLADDLTIKVSGFFRSQHTFHQIAELVLPELVAYKKNRGWRRLSIWSAACAHGEEPYSIAILLADFLGNRMPEFAISIYASDINRQALTEAREGIYSPKEVENLPSAILKSYFTHNDDGYIANSNIRQMVSFSYFDLVSTKPPPFTNLDCVFCCNILIYLQKQLQERVLGMVYDSLATPGYLVLGEVETPTDNMRPKLECLDAKAKIYKKTENKI
jgi:chemotaxis methyl-accepting protein methylase